MSTNSSVQLIYIRKFHASRHAFPRTFNFPICGTKIFSVSPSHCEIPCNLLECFRTDVKILHYNLQKIITSLLHESCLLLWGIELNVLEEEKKTQKKGTSKSNTLNLCHLHFFFSLFYSLLRSGCHRANLVYYLFTKIYLVLTLSLSLT